MATKALVIDGKHGKGAVWRNGEGYPNSMGKDILKYINKTNDFDIQGFFKSEYKKMNTFVSKYNEGNKDNDYIGIPADEYIKGNLCFSQVDTIVTPEYLKQIESNNYKGILKSKGMLNAEYKYLVLKDGVYVKGILTITEKKGILNFNNNDVREKTLRKINSYRKIFMKNGKLHFVDIDNKIHQVTLHTN